MSGTGTPDNATVAVLREPPNDGDWFLSIDSRSFLELDEPPEVDVMNKQEARDWRLEPYPADRRLGHFSGSTSLWARFLQQAGVRELKRNWVVLDGGVWRWDYGTPLSPDEEESLGVN